MKVLVCPPLLFLFLSPCLTGVGSFARFERKLTGTPTVGILVPESPVWQFNRALVEPAVELAMDKIRSDMRFLPAVRNISALQPEDSKCTEMAYASYKALEMYMNKPVT